MRIIRCTFIFAFCVLMWLLSVAGTLVYIYKQKNKCILSEGNASQLATDNDNVTLIAAVDIPFQLYVTVFNGSFTLSHKMGFGLAFAMDSFLRFLPFYFKTRVGK